MSTTAITVATAAGEVVVDLACVVACQDFAGNAPRWQGPVGMWLGAELVGVIIFSETEARSGKWPDMADADLVALEMATLDAIGSWGPARTPHGEFRESATVADYRTANAMKVAV